MLLTNQQYLVSTNVSADYQGQQRISCGRKNTKKGKENGENIKEKVRRTDENGKGKWMVKGLNEMLNGQRQKECVKDIARLDKKYNFHEGTFLDQI
jgi:hypothetical protein